MSSHGKGDGLSGAFWDDYDTYYEHQDFRAYELAVERVIHCVPPIPATDTEAEQPGMITIRGIHEELGVVERGDPRRRWTLDVLDSLLSIETIGVQPTKYRRRVGVVPMFAKRGRSQTLRHIFPLKQEEQTV